MTTTDLTEMFFRSGAPAPARPADQLERASYHWEETLVETCRRCGGAGGFRHWPGFTCFECNGACRLPYTYARKSYTAAKLAYLEAAEERRLAVRQAKAVAKAAAEAAAEAARFEPLRERCEAFAGDLAASAERAYAKAMSTGADNLLSDYWAARVGGRLAQWATEGRVAALEASAVKAREQAALLADAPPIAEGRYAFAGVVLATKWQESQYGGTLKMLVKLPDGNKLWGTVPSSLETDIGETVSLVATVQRSPSDPHFGFYSRPKVQK